MPALRPHKVFKYQTIETPFGWIAVGASSRGVACVTFPFPDQNALEAELTDGLGGKLVENVAGPLRDLCNRIRLYYEGRIVSLHDRLDLGLASPFEKAVWEAARSIPYGEVRTYSWVAREIGKPQAYRAAGQALGRNPYAILVPCHRVIASNGSLGGFSAGLGLKKSLLDLEARGRVSPHQA